MEEFKYVWLNTNTGKFSNSWDEKTQSCEDIAQEELDRAKADGWKLIKYQCLNNQEFEFMNKMKLR